jgi:hypothetical protein
MDKSSERDAIRTYQRRAVSTRRVGVDAKCACGEARPEALIPGSKPHVCAECQRRAQGKSVLDYHHVAGRSNSPVVISVPANDHRAVLSTAQYDWPKNTLENPEDLQLLKVAACIRGFIDTQVYLSNILRPLPELLEKLAELESGQTTDHKHETE